MTTSFVLILMVSGLARAGSEGLYELEKKHLENQKKIVELNSNITSVESKIVENSDLLQSKSLQIGKRIFALNSLQKQQWGLLFFNKNLRGFQKNLTLLKIINKHDTKLFGEYKYAERTLLKQRKILEDQRLTLLKIDRLIAQQQKQIQSLELSQIASLKKDNSDSLLLFKSELAPPVSGVVKTSFGNKQDDLDQFSYFISGLYFMTGADSPVKSIAPGKVIFADQIPYRGLTVIVEHPGEYYSVYSNLNSVSVPTESIIDSNFLIGKTANTDFYFELRHKNISIDPKSWLKIESKGQL
jgi:septal ring factor EnvC (AmiA/AmiB activator)